MPAQSGSRCSTDPTAHLHVHHLKHQLSILRARNTAARRQIEHATLEREYVATEIATVEAELKAAVEAPVANGDDPTAWLPNELMIMVLMLVGWAPECARVCQRWDTIVKTPTVQMQIWARRWGVYETGRRKPQTITCNNIHRLVIQGDRVYAFSKGYGHSRTVVYNRRDMTLERTLATEMSGCLDITVDDARMVYTSHFSDVEVRSGDDGQLVRTLKGHSDYVQTLVVDAAGRLYSGATDTTIRVWSCSTGACITTIRGHTGAVRSFAVGANNVLFSGSSDKTIRVWSDHAHVQTLCGHTGTVVSLAVGKDGTLVSGSHDGSIRVWSPVDLNPIRTFGGTSVKAVAIGLDGSIVSLRATGEIWRYSLQSVHGIRVYNVGQNSLNFEYDSALAFGPDGALYVGSDHTLHIF